MIKFAKDSPSSYRLNIAGVSLVISHETIVAAQYRSTSIRRRNEWGATTGKHLNAAGARNYDELERDEFNQQTEALILRAIADKFEARVA